MALPTTARLDAIVHQGQKRHKSVLLCMAIQKQMRMETQIEFHLNSFVPVKPDARTYIQWRTFVHTFIHHC